MIDTLKEIKNKLTPVFADYQVRKAILFGSYAKGTANENSDIDILVDSGLKGLAFFGLLEDIATPMEKRADLLDVSRITFKSEADNEIAKSGVLIYGK